MHLGAWSGILSSVETAMKQRMKSAELKRMDRVFWITMAIALPLLVLATYYWGFKLSPPHGKRQGNSASTPVSR